MSNSHDLLAIDVGSSRVKLGWFPAAGTCTNEKPAGNLPIAAAALPTPDEVFQVQHKDRSPADARAIRDDWVTEIDRWCDGLPTPPTACLIASVHCTAAEALIERLKRRPALEVKLLVAASLPITVRVETPERVGIDRLLGAVAVNQLRRHGAPAISIDMGTAITVDLVAPDGAFEGGAILAGPTISLTALHAGTASLPALDAAVLSAPPAPVGKNTAAAMAAGSYWSAVGGVNELIRRIAADCDQPPDVFLTGGASPAFASFVGLEGRPARHVPHLVLTGISLAAQSISAT